MGNRYFVEEERMGKIRKFGITFSKGAKFFNVVDKHKINDNINYLDDYLAIDHCEYLNDYDRAERFIVCRDKNNVYWVFTKSIYKRSIASSSYVRSASGVNYSKQGKSTMYEGLTEIKTGCNSFEEAEKVIQKMLEAYKKNDNSKSFEIVNSSCPAE